jgi:cyanophycinase
MFMDHVPGTLALVGSGEYLEPMEPVDRFLLSRLAGEPRVVCLPTAAGTEGVERIAYWSRLGVKHFTRLGAPAEAVEVIDRATADDEAHAARIRAANFVYLSGGKPDYLFRSLSGTRAWAAVMQVLDRGGVVAGCSAGAMIFGDSLPSFPTLLPFTRAFNFLPGAVILPHYDEMPGGFARVLRLLTGKKTLLGIEGNTALVRADGAFTVTGAGGVTVWNRRQKRRYTDGETVQWP